MTESSSEPCIDDHDTISVSELPSWERGVEMSMQNQAKIGLVAGYGYLPKVILQAAEKMGYKVFCAAIKGMANEDYKKYLDTVLYVQLGEIQKTIDFFVKNDVQQLILAGKVDKKVLFRPDTLLDPLAKQLLSSTQQLNDDTILLGIVNIFEKVGLKIMDSTALIQSILPQEGVLTPWQLDDNQMRDVHFGFKMAKAIGGLDIGQTVVVKNQAVMAAEAIEGTDEAILRGGSLGRNGCTVVKVAKPEQDLRFDVPTIGCQTLQSCVKAGVSTLAFEAGATILLDQEAVIDLAKQHKINVIAVSHQGDQ